MNEDEKRFLEIFKQVAPTLKATDEVIIAMRNLSLPLVSKARFRELYEQALAYLVAHRLTIQNIIAAEADGDGDGSGGATSSSLIAGSVLSEKEGDLARTYGVASSSKNGVSVLDPLEKTIYGLEFKRLRGLCVVTGVTRFG